MLFDLHMPPVHGLAVVLFDIFQEFGQVTQNGSCSVFIVWYTWDGTGKDCTIDEIEKGQGEKT